jgi:uncharacterized membrane protein YhaH (DUF805 family)
MSTPSGQQDPYDPNAYQSGQPPQGRGAQDMFAPEENIPRQDPYADTAQQQSIPGQAATGRDGQQGNYQQGAGGYQQEAGYRQGSGYPQGSGYGAATGRLTYLQGAPVGFVDAVRGAYSHLLTHHGRASRSAFWWFALAAAIIYAVAGVVSDRSWIAGVIVDIVVWIPTALASIFLAVRRLHDSDKSGWWWWIGFVPIVGWIVLLIFYLLPSTPGPNRFNRVR